MAAGHSHDHHDHSNCNHDHGAHDAHNKASAATDEIALRQQAADKLAKVRSSKQGQLSINDTMLTLQTNSL